MGPKTEARGTPDDTGTWSDIAPSRTICCFPFDRKLFNQVTITLLIPYLEQFLMGHFVKCLWKVHYYNIRLSAILHSLGQVWKRVQNDIFGLK